MTAVEVCRDCGRLSSFLPRGICVDCQDLRESRFQAVKGYLQEHEGASIMIVATETGVDESLIVEFVREGRLQYSGPDAGRIAEAGSEDLKARIRAQLAAQAGPVGTDPQGTDPQGPAAAPSSSTSRPAPSPRTSGMKSRTR